MMKKIFFSNESLPEDDPSCGPSILVDGVILVDSESVSIHVRIAEMVELGIGWTLELFAVFVALT